MKDTRTYMPGFTLRACLAALFGLAVVSLFVVFFELVDGSDVSIGAQAIPLPGMFVILPLLLVSGGFYALTRQRLLTRAEMLVAMFAMFLATPLVSAGFWTMMVGAIGTIPKTADFEVYDAWPSKLWPHGENIVDGALTESRRAELVTQGSVDWRSCKRHWEGEEVLPVLVNDGERDTSWVRIPVPLHRDGGGADLILGEPYLLTVLLRPDELSPETHYYCRVFYDDAPHFASEAFTARAEGERNYLHPDGFIRKGMYGLTVSAEARDTVFLEIGLTGRGRLALADAELISVGTLDCIYHGRQIIGEDRFETLGESPRAELLVKPRRMVSWAGLKFILAGYIPWRDWATPFFAWTSLAFLCLVGTFCLAAIMRRQWMESERYPLPLTRIPLRLLGEGEPTERAMPAIWRNRIMWLGFGVSLFWCFMKGWHAFNSNVPNMGIDVQLTPYFTDPGWGKMWYGVEMRNVTFTVTALFVSIAIFMELNVLMSLVAGFFLFRSQYWFGEATGLALKQDFPYPQQQQIGAYIAYAILIAFLARKHLWRTAKLAFSGERTAQADEVLSSRSALIVLAVCLAGITLWARWVGIPIRGVLVFFVFLMMVGLVSMKVRAECGTPMASFTPINMAQLLPIAGGMVFFGPAGVLLVIFANWIIFRYLFFLVPGMQLELIEVGRRFRLPPRHVVYTAALGILGGLVLGGWIHLSMGYAIGGDNFGERYPYMDKAHLVNDYHTEMAKANAAVFREDDAPAESTRFSPPMFGYLFAAGATGLITVLRHVFTGFWFHPIGFIVSSTPLMEYTWGSILAAFAIRAITLKIGGAVVVRDKLLPFFVGVFLASLTAHLCFSGINAYLYFFYPSVARAGLLF